ncbi:hypothetical protein DLH72_02860 [Candidatus Gracilibacteria bacterium]|nr:MAG: hypothetical protein DLH72_02860 [Candidatus Gracilibacteria bacterium]
MLIDSDSFDFNFNELEASFSTNHFELNITYLFRVLISISKENIPKCFTFHFKMNFKDETLSDKELDSLILGEVSKLNIFNLSDLKILSCSYRPIMEDMKILN